MDRIYETTPQNTSELNTKVVNTKLEKTLFDFGIEDRWIVKKTARKKVDSVNVIYNVIIPKDLPVHNILSELNLALEEFPLQIISKEKKINKETELKILYQNKLMLLAEFSVGDTTFRRQDSVGFILTDFNKLNKDERKELFSLPEQYAISFVPSSASEQDKNEVVESGREYVIIINDNMNEAKFRLKNDYSLSRNQSSIRNIISSFPEAKKFFIDSGSDYFRSELGKIMKQEFRKRRLELFELGNFYLFTDDVEDLNGWFKNVIGNKYEKNKIVVIPVKEYIELLPSLEAQRKKGNKFVDPSKLNFTMK